ncbi:MAG: hypothetical protein ABWZ76_13055 [Acidimicrobiales bacterium]
MSPGADDPGDLAALRGHAAELVAAVEAALPGWIERLVADRWIAWRGEAVPEEVQAAARDAGQRARAEVVPVLRTLLSSDVDAQWTNPLSVLRGAVRYATEVLAGTGVPAVVRDAQDERLFPDDIYGLTPAAFADIDPSVQEPGLVWGAGKAHVVLQRHRRP